VVKKLGSLLGIDEDIARRKQLATVAFNSLWSLWKRRDAVREVLRIRLYNAFVIPVLTYNAGTWGASAAALASLDSFHRKQLRRLLGIFHPQHINNAALYTRCGSEPISKIVQRARWRLFGHILRLPLNTPPQMAMEMYFLPTDAELWRGRPRSSLPVIIKQELKQQGISLHTVSDLNCLRNLALHRPHWHAFFTVVIVVLSLTNKPHAIIIVIIILIRDQQSIQYSTRISLVNSIPRISRCHIPA